MNVIIYDGYFKDLLSSRYFLFSAHMISVTQFDIFRTSIHVLGLEMTRMHVSDCFSSVKRGVAGEPSIDDDVQDDGNLYINHRVHVIKTEIQKLKLFDLLNRTQLISDRRIKF